MTCRRPWLNPDFVFVKKLLGQRLVPQPALESVGHISGRLIGPPRQTQGTG
jgi:hypothetical protein